MTAAELLALAERVEGLLGVLVGEDPRFHVWVGGNPNVVEAMLDEARNTLAALLRAKAAEVAG